MALLHEVSGQLLKDSLCSGGGLTEMISSAVSWRLSYMCFVKDRKIGYLGLIQAPSAANRQSLLCNQEQKLPEMRAVREKIPSSSI